MPNRIIKESICDNEKIAALKDFDFRLWVGLITQADDAGRGDARPQIIKGRVFPLREQVTHKNIADGLNALASTGLISLYTVGGKPFFWFPGWAEHQRVRECKPKFPGPEESDILPQSAASCGELPQSAASCGLNPIQSNTNPNTNPNPKRAGVREDDFERFWSVYPKKVGKGEAKKAFSKVSVAVDTLIQAVERQKRSEQWSKDGGRYIPNPATWLNQGRWDDVLPTKGLACVSTGDVPPNDDLDMYERVWGTKKTEAMI